MHAHFFCTFGTDLQAQSVLIDTISTTSELSRKFVESALLVGSAPLVVAAGLRAFRGKREGEPCIMQQVFPSQTNVVGSRALIPMSLCGFFFFLICSC